jgi:adenylate kinase
MLGLSGSGKTRLAARIVAARPDFLKLSAGRLLREALHTTGRALRTAPSEEVLENQRRLVQVLQHARAGREGQPVLLEAHAFVDNDRELIDVPVDVMRAMDVSGLLVLVASPEIIHNRRVTDLRRRRPHRTVDDLSRQQEHMLELARKYASGLPAEIAVVESGDLPAALRFLDHFRSPSR